MTHFDPENPGRTLHNGSVFDTRQVFEVTSSALLDEVQSVFGTGEVERTGRKVQETRVYHVIALTEPLARALFEDRYGRYGRHTVLTVRALFTIDGEITAGHR